MNSKVILSFTLSMILSSTIAFGEDLLVQSLSQGACWFESGEILKLTSFNDKESFVISKEEVESEVQSLVEGKRKERDQVKDHILDMNLHCGGYGASLVVKTVVNNLPACIWLKLDSGKLRIRSVGSLESTKNEMCDGYKWGELVVGIKSAEQLDSLKSENFSSRILSVTVINSLTLKLILKPEYSGKEVEVMEELRKQIDLKYIELNSYQHPVGESVSIK